MIKKTPNNNNNNDKKKNRQHQPPNNNQTLSYTEYAFEKLLMGRAALDYFIESATKHSKTWSKQEEFVFYTSVMAIGSTLEAGIESAEEGLLAAHNLQPSIRQKIERSASWYEGREEC